MGEPTTGCPVGEEFWNLQTLQSSRHALGVLLPPHHHADPRETSGPFLCLPTSNSEGHVPTSAWWGLHSGPDHSGSFDGLPTADVCILID